MTDRNRHFAILALLLSLGSAAYFRALGNGFVYDDQSQILRNPLLRSSQHWTGLLTSDVWGYRNPNQRGASNYYRPLQMLTYRFTELLAGLNPRSFHAVNVLFYLLTVLVAYGVLWELTRREILSLAGGVLFALHPIHAEAVVWISSLPEVGCGLFYLLSAWLFLLARGASEPAVDGLAKSPVGRSRRIFLWVSSVACFALALLWKEMALTLPLVIGVYAIVFPRGHRSWMIRLRWAGLYSLPYWVVTAVYIGVRFKVLGFFSRVQHGWDLTPLQYALNVCYLCASYWWKLFLPVHLNAFHVLHPIRSIRDPRAAISIAFLLLAGALIGWALRREPLAGFAGLWVFLTLLPVLNLRGVGENVFAERYLYIPSLGFCLLLALLASKGIEWIPSSKRRGAALATLTIVAALYLAQTIRRIPDWKDDLTFYTRTVEASPDSSLMRSALAQGLKDKGDLAGAESEYRLALNVAGDDSSSETRLHMATAYLGLAGLYTQRGEFEKALQAVDRGQSADHDLPELYVARAVILINLGRLVEARRILLDVNQARPNDEIVLNALGAVALGMQETSLGQAYFERAIQVFPDYADAHNNLGRAYSEEGRTEEALSQLRMATQLAPENPGFHTNLGVVLGRLGRFAEARKEFYRALALAPDFPAARANLAVLDRLDQRHAPDPQK